MDHEVYKEMTALDALGVLEEAEADALRAHLAGCEACRAEADEMNGVAAMLAHATPPVRPPQELRAVILDIIRSTKTGGNSSLSGAEATATRTLERADEGVSLKGETEAHRAAKVASNVLPFAPERAAPRGTVVFSKSAFTFGAIAASLLVAALAATLGLLWTRNNELRAETARLSARSEELAARFTETERELARAREVTELLAAPGAHMLSLAGTKTAPGARAAIAYDPQSGRAVLVASDLPQAPAGKAYQLWFIAGKRPPMPGKVFRTDASGHALLRDQMPKEASDADTFAVTLEPEAGVAAPTGEMYLLGKLS